ncbi:MAG: hypothetical protein V3V20_12160, partial [Algisphaera sp.]
MINRLTTPPSSTLKRRQASSPAFATALLLTASLGLANAGCDQGAAATYVSRTQLEDAVQLVNDAERGFAGDTEDYAAFRTAKLTEAQGKLESLVTSDDPATQAGALRLLASVQTSAARRQSREAGAAFAQMSAASANLSHQLAAIDVINQVILSHRDDGSTIVEALREGASKIETSQNAITQRVAELKSKRESHVEAAQVAHDRAAALFDDARKADEAGFATQDIDRKQKALRAAYTAQMGGEAARLEALTAEIAAERLASEVAALETEADLWSTMSQQVADLQTQQTSEGTTARELFGEGEKARVLGLEGLATTYDQLVNRFNAEVSAPLDAAVAAADDAVAKYGKAAGLIKEQNGRKTAEFGRFTAQMELINALTHRAAFAFAFATLGESIAASPAVGDSSADTYTTGQEALSSQASAAAERARTL